MITFCKSILPDTERLTPEAFNQIVDSKVVADNCAKIREIAETLPTAPTKDDWAQFKRAIAPYKNGDRQRAIPSLPGFCFHASFPGGKRKNDDARLSGLVTIDLDGMLYPRETFDSFKDDAIDMGLCLAYVSPSTKGLKMVFAIPQEAHSLEEAQRIIVKKLNLDDFADGATTDAARLSFASPRSYILYYDEDELFADRQLPIGFLTKDVIEAADAVDASKESNAPLPKNVAAEETYKGIPYKTIIEELAMRLFGKTWPEPGERHNRLMQALPYVRTICDDDYNKMLRVMPQWDPEPAKFRASIRDIQKYRISNRCFEVMESIVAKIKAQQALESGQQSPWTMPELPQQLPPVFKEFARVTPIEFKPAVMFSLMPLLGVYGSMVKVNCSPRNATPRYYTPSFDVCIIALPASGKSIITFVRNRIMRKLLAEDRRNTILYSDWQQRRNRDDYKGKEPKGPIYNQPERLSLTSLTKQMSNAAGRHILMFTPEIDTLKSNNGSGAWNDLSTVIRKATDNDEVGQMYMSSESFSCSVKTYLNILMEAQPRTMRKFFNVNNVENGLVDRVNFVELPDNTGMEEVFMRCMSEAEEKRIDNILDSMFSVGTVVRPAQKDDKGVVIEPPVLERVEISLPRTLRALGKWCKRHQDHYMQSQTNPAEDHFMRRAKQTGIKAAMLGYMTSGMKETMAVVRFAEWAAEYDLRMHIYLFGKTWNKLLKADIQAKEDNNTFAQTVDSANLFDELPAEFSVHEVVALERQHGITDSNPNQKLMRWRKRGLLKDTGKLDGQCKVYKKVKNKIAA